MTYLSSQTNHQQKLFEESFNQSEKSLRSNVFNQSSSDL